MCHILHRTGRPPGYRDRIVGISNQVLRTPPHMSLPLGAVYILFTQNNVVLAYGESDGVGHEVWRVTFEKGTTLGTLAIADDYIKKPFRSGELLARIAVKLKRVKK